ncbi:hypothetical protein J8340_23105, partial [Escherichia coli]|nr:hypothetical protein [Escherichia coli]
MNEYLVIARGRTAEVLSLNNEQVLKLFNVGLSEQIIQEEFVISSIVYKLGVACPEPIKITEYNGRTGIIFSRIHGTTMLDIISKKFWKIN